MSNEIIALADKHHDFIVNKVKEINDHLVGVRHQVLITVVWLEQGPENPNGYAAVGSTVATSFGGDAGAMLEVADMLASRALSKLEGENDVTH